MPPPYSPTVATLIPHHPLSSIAKNGERCWGHKADLPSVFAPLGISPCITSPGHQLILQTMPAFLKPPLPVGSCRALRTSQIGVPAIPVLLFPCLGQDTDMRETPSANLRGNGEGADAYHGASPERLAASMWFQQARDLLALLAHSGFRHVSHDEERLELRIPVTKPHARL